MCGTTNLKEKNTVEVSLIPLQSHVNAGCYIINKEPFGRLLFELFVILKCVWLKMCFLGIET